LALPARSWVRLLSRRRASRCCADRRSHSPRSPRRLPPSRGCRVRDAGRVRRTRKIAHPRESHGRITPFDLAVRAPADAPEPGDGDQEVVAGRLEHQGYGPPPQSLAHDGDEDRAADGAAGADGCVTAFGRSLDPGGRTRATGVLTATVQRVKWTFEMSRPIRSMRARSCEVLPKQWFDLDKMTPEGRPSFAGLNAVLTQLLANLAHLFG